jgi:hypothetical protein
LAYLNKVICFYYFILFTYKLKNKNYANFFFGNFISVGLLLGIGTANNRVGLMALITQTQMV